MKLRTFYLKPTKFLSLISRKLKKIDNLMKFCDKFICGGNKKISKKFLMNFV